MRRAVRRLGLVAVALLAACSDSPSTSPPPASVPAAGGTIAAPTTVEPPPAERFEIQTFDVAAAEGSSDSFARVRNEVTQALDRYLEKAVLTPLRSGRSAGNLSDVFAGAAAERMAGPDRPALVDEGLPPLSGVVLEKATAMVAVLVGRGRETGVATASISIVVRGMSGTAPLRLERSGNLELGPDGDSWKIIGYEVRASRDTAEESATAGA